MSRNLLSLHSSHFYSHEKGMGKLYSQEMSAHVLDFFFFSFKAKQTILTANHVLDKNS